MVGTRVLAGLDSRVHQAGARIVLIGDACQLSEIEAGGAFAGLARRTNPAALRTNRRQHERWERQTLADLRLGLAPEALPPTRPTIASTTTPTRGGPGTT